MARIEVHAYVDNGSDYMIDTWWSVPPDERDRVFKGRHNKWLVSPEAPLLILIGAWFQSVPF